MIDRDVLHLHDIPEASVYVADGHDTDTLAPLVLLVVENRETVVIAPLTPERAEAIADDLRFWAVAARNR